VHHALHSLDGTAVYECVPDAGHPEPPLSMRSGVSSHGHAPVVVDRRFCVAPMMDRTDRHCRFFFRLMSRRAMLYTEMITALALAHGDVPRLLKFHPAERPLGLQVGGSEPEHLAIAARLAQQFNYDEINLNVGCPSSRVSSGRFGACLMAEPERVAECVRAMREASRLPVTVKTRIGIDHDEGFEALERFVAPVAVAGCRTFIIHARKAWLSGLNPKQNREIPPLRYDLVHRLKQEFPGIEVIINGGFTDIDTARAQLKLVDGVMLGREIYRNPYLLSAVDEMFFADARAGLNRQEVLERYAAYADEQLARGQRMQALTRHLTGLYAGMPGGRAYRRHLSETATRCADPRQVLLAASSAAGISRFASHEG
jgi:tRNA-dihydrouridine synthase A